MNISEDQKFSVRVFKPGDITLFRTEQGDSRVRLTISDDRSYLDVRIARAFPFTRPAQYIGLRDAAETDIGLIVEPSEFDVETREIIRAELSRRYFTPRVKKVISVREEHGTVTFRVETDRGERRFVVRHLRDHAYSLGAARVLVTDTEGNKYEFPDITQFGARTYEVLAKVM